MVLDSGSLQSLVPSRRNARVHIPRPKDLQQRIHIAIDAQMQIELSYATIHSHSIQEPILNLFLL